MGERVERPGVRAGYDTWAESYDGTANPLVALDRRHTVGLLAPGPGERILDAGCGTGGNLKALVGAGSEAVGLDFSRGMLQVARRALGPMPPANDCCNSRVRSQARGPRAGLPAWGGSSARLAQADLNQPLPLRPRAFDAVLCALVGEHLEAPAHFFTEAWGVLAPGGRFVFSVFHPEMAAAGLEANFQKTGVEYRLGAHRHSVDDYLGAIEDAGFDDVVAHAFAGDETLAAKIPSARKYVGQPLLLAIEARRS